jgi:hypothetical protein
MNFAKQNLYNDYKDWCTDGRMRRLLSEPHAEEQELL